MILAPLRRPLGKTSQSHLRNFLGGSWILWDSTTPRAGFSDLSKKMDRKFWLSGLTHKTSKKAMVLPFSHLTNAIRHLNTCNGSAASSAASSDRTTNYLSNQYLSNQLSSVYSERMLTDTIMQAPSVQRLVDALFCDLSTRRSQLLLLPAGAESIDLWPALEGRLLSRDFYVEEILLPELPNKDRPVRALGEALNVQWPEASSPRSVANLMISGGLPQIIHLKGFEELPEPVRVTWLDFLRAWTQTSKSLSDRNLDPPALSIFTPGSALPDQVPESDLHLSVHYWWGLPSALEIQMLCRSENADSERSPRRRWREHLTPAITGNDIALAEYLWDRLHLDCEQLLPLLRAFGERRGWTPQLLHDWNIEDFLPALTGKELRSPRLPPSRWYQLWAHGVLHWTPEYGPELHPAALAVLGRAEDLQHRLWRGQTHLALPLIDNIRISICRHLSQQYGEDWPLRWCPPDIAEEADAVRDSPFACQWGHLVHLFRNCGSLRREHPLLPVVELTREIRNNLAHYRPITLQDFERLWHEMGRIRHRITVSSPA